MATQPKLGKRNDLDALRTARQKTTEIETNAQRANDEIKRMREQSGRPDYTRIIPLLTDIALANTSVSRSLEEMWTLRAKLGMVDDELVERVQALEAQVAGLIEACGVRDEETLYPSSR